MTNFKSTSTVEKENENRFAHTCMYGQYAEVVLTYKPEYDVQFAFAHTCGGGRLKIAKWLWINSIKPIDIHNYHEEVFRWACMHGHIEMAQWIHSLGGVDHHALEDFSFREACNNGHRDIAEWVYSLGGIRRSCINVSNSFCFDYCGDSYIQRWLLTLPDTPSELNPSDVFKFTPPTTNPIEPGFTKTEQLLIHNFECIMINQKMGLD